MLLLRLKKWGGRGRLEEGLVYSGYSKYTPSWALMTCLTVLQLLEPAFPRGFAVHRSVEQLFLPARQKDLRLWQDPACGVFVHISMCLFTLLLLFLVLQQILEQPSVGRVKRAALKTK